MTKIDTNSSQNVYEVHKFVNIGNLIKKLKEKKVTEGFLKSL